ncbi:biopolymer transporter ExbD [Limnohabitans sp. 2KL-27]|uniref:ExbD/TolR family protein n=1 Tax=Limnohabitans sp. 2KL-27 TaxID=1100705 RepID=UPI000A69DD36|nr:biopolymer transporter ExbD [Limnohabitans sp. 2KL-27]
MAMNLGTGSTDESEVMMDINTTPLIDVMLVLIIMLIITIPAQLHAVNLDMPVASSAAPPLEPVVIRLDIEADSRLRWNGQLLADRPALEAQLAEAAARQPQPELHIRSHAQAQYAATAAVLASAQRLGLKKLGILGTERFAGP